LIIAVFLELRNAIGDVSKKHCVIGVNNGRLAAESFQLTATCLKKNGQ
jgi:hypothetical protein